MNTVVSLVTRFLAKSQLATSRDFGDILPSTSVGPALICASAVITVVGILDLIHYWPR